MDTEEIIKFTKRFMDSTTGYSDFRHGGNLGMIVAGFVIAKELEKLTTAIQSLSDDKGSE